VSSDYRAHCKIIFCLKCQFLNHVFRATYLIDAEWDLTKLASARNAVNRLGHVFLKHIFFVRFPKYEDIKVHFPATKQELPYRMRVRTTGLAADSATYTSNATLCLHVPVAGVGLELGRS